MCHQRREFKVQTVLMGEQVKIPLLPHNVGKKSVNDLGATIGSWQTLMS